MNIRVSIGGIARIGITLNLIIGILAILLSRFNPSTHSMLTSLAIPLSFPLTVYISFVAGLKGGSPREGLEGLSALASIALAIMSPLVVLYSKTASLAIASLSLASALYFTIIQIRVRREPWLLFIYPLIIGIIGLSYGIVESLDTFDIAIVLAMTFATPLIFTVSVMTMTRNYRVPLSPLNVYTLLTVNALSFTAFIYSERIGLILYILFLILYFPSIGYYNLLKLLDLARKASPLFRAVSRYIVVGHTAALISTLLLAYHVIIGSPKIILIHILYMGFIGSHIFLHIPLMIPFIIGIGSSKRYNPIPFILLIVAVILRPIQPDIAYAVIVLSFIALALVIKP